MLTRKKEQIKGEQASNLGMGGGGGMQMTCILYVCVVYTHNMLNKSVHFLGPKKKIVMLPSPDQHLKIGSVGRDFFFLRTVRELSFPLSYLSF